MTLGTIYQIESSKRWRLQIRRPGAPISQTFATEAEAIAARKTLNKLLAQGGAQDMAQAHMTRVHEVLEWYRDHISPSHKGWKWESVRLNLLLRQPRLNVRLSENVSQAVREWVATRQTEVKAASVNREINLLSSVFKAAMEDGRIPRGDNPIKFVKRPKVVGGERDIVWTDDDVLRWLDHLQFDANKAPHTMVENLGWFILLLRFTGFRSGNAKMLDADRLKGLHAVFGMGEVKNGSDWRAPMSSVARRLIDRLREHRGPKEQLISRPLGSLQCAYREERFALAEQHPHMAKLRLHDLRHTWTTEAWHAMPIKDEVTFKLITGRKSSVTLQRYINPNADDLAAYLDGRVPQAAPRAVQAKAELLTRF